jgi:uncharacterized protein (DUF302 family)
METGKHHAPALPCKVYVWADNDANVVYVDMLNPQAIFGLFFADLDDATAEALSPVATAVKEEIQLIVQTALENQSGIEFITEGLGPKLSNSDAEPEKNGGFSPIITHEYSDGSGTLTDTDAGTLAKSILYSLGVVKEGVLSEPAETRISLSSALSSGSAWRSARYDGTTTYDNGSGTQEIGFALGLPLSIKVIEPCSPLYAKEALSTGRWHAGALPCKVAVYQDGGSLYVSYLNPEFMFNVLFRDADEELLTSLADLPETVFDDLKLIVADGVENSGLSLSKQ